MRQPTMTASFAASMLQFAVTKGADQKALLAASGLSLDDLAGKDARVPMAAYHALIQAAIRATGDPALVMRHSSETSLDHLSVVGLILNSSPTFRAAIRQLNRYTRLIADVDPLHAADRFELRDEGGQTWLIDHFPEPNRTPTAIEDTFTRFITEFRRNEPDKPFALQAKVTFPRPAHAAAYSEIWHCPVHFGADRNAICIAQHWANQTTRTTNEYVFGIFTDHANAMMAELDASQTTRANVEACILPELHTGTISMDKVAQDLGMSRQTLYRRLQEEGLTFAELHDELRARMARDYLTARKVSVNETAYLLGFSEASSFVRAFKRWTGMSPKAFRESLV